MVAELDLSVIVVNFNTREVTCECLTALDREMNGIRAEIFVVDNASSDGSVEAIRQSFPAVQVIENRRNLGFGAANNVALAQARGRFILFVNSDAIMLPGSIGALCEYLDQHPEVGLVGPKLLNADGSMQHSCFRFPSPLRSWLESLLISHVLTNQAFVGDYYRWAHDTERRVDFVSGACMLSRKEIYAKLGGFDERFFMYQEETDWQRRITAAGWKIVFFPGATVTHYGGKSGKHEPKQVNEMFLASFEKYQLKHYGPIGLWAVRAAMLVGCCIRLPMWLVAMFFPSKRGRALIQAERRIRVVLRQLSGRPLA